MQQASDFHLFPPNWYIFNEVKQILRNLEELLKLYLQNHNKYYLFSQILFLFLRLKYIYFRAVVSNPQAGNFAGKKS